MAVFSFGHKSVHLVKIVIGPRERSERGLTKPLLLSTGAHKSATENHHFWEASKASPEKWLPPSWAKREKFPSLHTPYWCTQKCHRKPPLLIGEQSEPWKATPSLSSEVTFFQVYLNKSKVMNYKSKQIYTFEVVCVYKGPLYPIIWLRMVMKMAITILSYNKWELNNIVIKAFLNS